MKSIVRRWKDTKFVTVTCLLEPGYPTVSKMSTWGTQAHAYLTPERGKAYGNRLYPAHLASFPAPGALQGLLTAEAHCPHPPDGTTFL